MQRHLTLTHCKLNRFHVVENYRLQSKYENHLIAKVGLFQFVNSFLSLFYIAFYLRDQEKLKEQLAGLLISRQIIGNLRESAIPYFMEQLKLAKLSFSMWGALSPTQEKDVKISVADCKVQFRADFSRQIGVFIHSSIHHRKMTINRGMIRRRPAPRNVASAKPKSRAHCINTTARLPITWKYWCKWDIWCSSRPPFHWPAFARWQIIYSKSVRTHSNWLTCISDRLDSVLRTSAPGRMPSDSWAWPL